MKRRGIASPDIADASYVEGQNGLISALSSADEFCFIAGGRGSDEGGLACCLRHHHVYAGTGRRYGKYDLAVPTRTRPIDREDRPAAHRDRRAMAASGIMDHSVAGSFASRMSGVHTGMAAENIAAGTKTWAETFHVWQNSPGHNSNLLQFKADSVGVAVARNDQTRYKTFWAMVIAEKSPKRKDRKVATGGEALERGESLGTSENPISAIRNFVCKYLC